MRPPLPRIAIVGRPNVGKSTLLNRMAGSRVAIVEPTPGVTRDRITVPVRLPGPEGERWVEVMDTGGIGIVDRDDLGALVEEQVDIALAMADVVFFVVDARDGPTPLDARVAERLRRVTVPVLLLANKAEGERPLWEVDAFRRLGVGEGPFPISAQNAEGLAPVYDRALELLPAADPEAYPLRAELVEDDDDEARDTDGMDETDDTGDTEPVVAGGPLKVAIVGRRNAGKSTLVNKLAGEERMIVSEIPGTTRDAVDVLLEKDGETWIVIDTAGVRKQRSFNDAVEFYGDARSHRAVRRADVVVLLFDAVEELTALDKRLARYVIDHYKPLVLAANKWDLVAGRMQLDQLRKYLDDLLPGVRWVPLLQLSAKTGRGVEELLPLARRLHTEALHRVPTGELNRILAAALTARSPSAKGHRVRLRYATQARGAPPTFVLFVNDKRLIGQSYLRYLENRLREELPFKDVPVHVVLRDERRSAGAKR